MSDSPLAKNTETNSDLNGAAHDPEIKEVHILLVEDDPDDILLVEHILAADYKGFRFKLQFARTLVEAQLLAHSRVDAIVLDLNLSDSRGIQTFTRLQQAVPDLPIVVLTAVNDSEQGIETVKTGAQDYLIKGQFESLFFTRTILYAIERHKIKEEQAVLTAELRATNVRLEKQMLLDSLTGVLNRRGLQDALSRELERSRRSDNELMALLLDLDNFKNLNETLGYPVGDVALKEITQRLVLSVRLTDYVARVGGDEFLILMPQTRCAEGSRVAEKVRRAISRISIPLSGTAEFNVTASFGLIDVSPDLVSVDDLLVKAHWVLEKSKRTGKNRVSYGLEGGEEGPYADILTALRRPDQYSVVKQPILNLQNNQVVGFEFLSRFTVKGLESPDDFFRVCLENSMLTHVDRQCLHNCAQAGASLPAGFKRHFNLFPSTLIDIPVQNLLQAFEQENREGCCIEISEQQIIGDPSYLMEPVRLFKENGLRIAIDDVGFGRSCLESLILLEPDIVKIDKKWVNGISKNEWCERSLRRLLKVTQALDIEVIAEGIEVEEDRDALVRLDVKYGQGYLLGRPE